MLLAHPDKWWIIGQDFSEGHVLSQCTGANVASDVTAKLSLYQGPGGGGGGYMLLVNLCKSGYSHKNSAVNSHVLFCHKLSTFAFIAYLPDRLFKEVCVCERDNIDKHLQKNIKSN